MQLIFAMSFPFSRTLQEGVEGVTVLSRFVGHNKIVGRSITRPDPAPSPFS